MDKEFSEVFQEEIVNEGKIEELGKQIAGIADKFKEGKDDVMTMADEMISQGNMPDPEAIKMFVSSMFGCARGGSSSEV